MKRVLFVIFMCVLFTASAYASPKYSYDSCERVIFTNDHEFDFEYGIKGDNMSIITESNKCKLILDWCDLYKDYEYTLRDKKTKKTYKGTFRVKRKFPILNSEKKILSFYKRSVEQRKPLIRVYTSMSWDKVKKVAGKINKDYYIESYQSSDNVPMKSYMSNNPIKFDNKRYYAIYTEPYYLMSKTRHVKYKKAINKIVKGLSGSNRKKVCKIDRWFTKNCRYGKYYNAHNAILDKRAYCDGFTRAVNAICTKANIPNMYVAENKINHAWNLVKINGKWYHVDVTWDVSTGKSGRWILKGCNDSTFNKSHKIGSSFYKRYKAKKYFGKKNLSTKI